MLNRRYESSSTVSGAFDRQPDQVARLVGDEILYFCEDGGADCGVHGRDGAGRFFSILDGPAYDTETTGLAFSPDKRHMYVRRADPPQTGRNDAAATTWTRLRRGYGVDTWSRVRLETRARLRYVSFQTPGIIFDITRDDGQPFDGGVLDIKYHDD